VQPVFGLPFYLDLTLPIFALATIPNAGAWQTSLAIPNDASLASAAVALQTLTTPSTTGPLFDISNGIFWVIDF
jgi:hypothetical protein